MKRLNYGFGTILVLSIIAIAVIALLFFHPAAAAVLCPVAAITEDQLATLAEQFKDASTKLNDASGKFDKSSQEVRDIGKQILADVDANKKSSDELKKQVDEALTEQGKLKTELLQLQQEITKELKKIFGSVGGPQEGSLGLALEKAKDEIKAFGENRVMQKNVQIPLSRKALMESGATGTALIYPGQNLLAAPLMPLQRKLMIRDLLAQGRTNSPAIWYQKETGFTNNAAPVSEGSLKPKSDITFDLVHGAVTTLAHLQDISLQMLNDVPFIQSYVENRMRYGLKLVEENQLLNGSGTGQNLNGIYTQATAYAQPAGSSVANEQDLDKIRLAILQVELAFADVTGIVLHPVNWANIELIKDTQNRYIIANPQQTTTGTVWGRPVVSTVAMTVGKFLVGDFALYAQIFDREDANLAISFENKDNFERNMATLRLEERLALAVYRPEAFVKGTLESASH